MDAKEKSRQSAAISLPVLIGIVWLAVFPLWQDGSYTRITRAKWEGMLILCGISAVLGVVCL